MESTLGTRLRHLIELLDGAVSDAYVEAGLKFRPRYTPVMRALLRVEPCTVGQIAGAARISQLAATQTIALMIKEGLVSVETGRDDGRQKLIRLTARGRKLLPQLKLCWQVTASAASRLEKELPFPLSQAMESALAALATRPFDARLREARARLQRAKA